MIESCLMQQPSCIDIINIPIKVSGMTYFGSNTEMFKSFNISIMRRSKFNHLQKIVSKNDNLSKVQQN